MKRLHIFLFLLLAAATISCSDTGVRDDTSYLRISAQFIDPSKGATTKKNGQVQAGRTADSLIITRMRLLVSGMKIFREGQDTASGGTMIKAEPIVVDVSSALVSLYTVTFQEGNYDRIKVAFHRLSGSEVDQYKSNPAYSDFAGDDRPSVIIEGRYFQDSAYHDFTYRTDIAQSLQLTMAPSVGIPPASTTDLVLQIVLPDLLAYGKNFLDPGDAANKTEIDASIANAIRAAKKQF